MLGIEHLLFVLTTFAFPPVALTVLLCIILATFGKSLGLRQMYVDTLINIFEVCISISEIEGQEVFFFSSS